MARTTRSKYTKADLEIAKDMAKFVHDPLAFVRYMYPWGEGVLEDYSGPQEWQVEVLKTIGDSLQKNPYQPIRVARSSGHGIGKSACVSWLIEWGLYTCPNARILTTANTASQLATKTWPELSTWHNRNIAKHWFTLTGTSLQYSLAPGYEANWRADAVTWSQSNTEAFAGLHNKGNRIILIFDEASAILDKIWEVAEGALTDEDTEIIWIAFGNPTRNTGRFRECFRRYRNMWNTGRIDSRTVSVTNKHLINQWKESYGEDSDFFRVRVTGEFPDQATGQLIPTSLVHEAMDRKYKYDDITPGKPKILGVDCAREGGDASCIWLRQGFYTKRLFKTFEIKSNILASKVASIMDKEKPDRVFIDMGNIGAAILDQLKSWGYNNITGIWFSNSPDDTRVFGNKRIEMWDRMRQWLEDGGMLPPKNCDESLDIENDLIAPEFFYTSRGLKMLEAKSDMKARGLPSPDDGDALALTFSTKIFTKRNERPADTKLGRNAVPMGIDTWNPYVGLSIDNLTDKGWEDYNV